MKKLMFLMMALMVAPAMADVVFSVVDNGDTTADIKVEFTGADTVGGANVKSLIAGIALNVSVSSGNIVAVTNYKGDDFPTTPAVSTNASPGYGIHMSTITFSGDPCEIATAGTPQAPYDSPTGPSIVLPASDIVLEHGALFDVGVPGDAPLASLQRLCTIEVSEGATLTITGGNTTRGGVVRLGGGVPTTIDYGSGTVVTGFNEDYGDAPDPLVATAGEYPTLLANNGARHTIGGPFLGPEGDEPDVDADGQPNAGATGDDIAGSDDEDGVTIGTLAIGIAGPITFEVNGGGGDVSAWIDYNGNGVFDDSGETLLSGAAYADGIHVVNATAPSGSAGTTYVRFRITTSGALNPYGLAVDGEVEDHQVTIIDSHTLTVATDGTGTGTVDGPYALGAQLVADGTIVDVIGTPAGGSVFVARAPVGTFAMTTDALVTLTFDLDAPPECMKNTHPGYARWDAIGKPDCWCYEYQYAGDINGILAFDWYPVNVDDLTLFVDAYMDGPGELPDDGECADLNHIAAFDWYAVNVDDLTLFVANYMDGYLDFPANADAAHFNFYTTPPE